MNAAFFEKEESNDTGIFFISEMLQNKTDERFG